MNSGAVLYLDHQSKRPKKVSRSFDRNSSAFDFNLTLRVPSRNTTISVLVDIFNAPNFGYFGKTGVFQQPLSITLRTPAMGPLCDSCQDRSTVTGWGETDWVIGELSVLRLAALPLRTDYAAALGGLGHRVCHVVPAQLSLTSAGFDFHRTNCSCFDSESPARPNHPYCYPPEKSNRTLLTLHFSRFYGLSEQRQFLVGWPTIMLQMESQFVVRLVAEVRRNIRKLDLLPSNDPRFCQRFRQLHEPLLVPPSRRFQQDSRRRPPRKFGLLDRRVSLRRVGCEALRKANATWACRRDSDWAALSATACPRRCWDRMSCRPSGLSKQSSHNFDPFRIEGVFTT
jgi:hypothetical protein